MADEPFENETAIYYRLMGQVGNTIQWCNAVRRDET